MSLMVAAPVVRFWLGTHKPGWLARTEVPLFVSHRTLGGRRELPRARGPWALDSGCVGHRNCANCLPYALAWRDQVLADLNRPWQPPLHHPIQAEGWR
jgi:hypothetical protein